MSDARLTAEEAARAYGAVARELRSPSSEMQALNTLYSAARENARLREALESLTEEAGWFDLLHDARQEDGTAGIYALDTTNPQALAAWIADVIAEEVRYAALPPEGREEEA